MFVGIVQSITVIAACVLGVAGLHKLRTPVAATTALRAQGFRATSGWARALGALELGVAAAGIIGGRAGALAVAALYVALTGFALRAVRRNAPCGCFGRDESPATNSQAALDVVFAAAAAIAATSERFVVTAIDPTAGLSFLSFVMIAGCGVILVLQIVGPLGEVLTYSKRSAR